MSTWMTDPAAAGFDAQRLARIGAHLRASYVDTGRIAGAQVLVARHGHVAYAENVGKMDLATGADVRDDTLWRIYSMTKPITSVALMMLCEKGLFKLTDPVSRFIPAFADLRVMESAPDGSINEVAPERPMNVRDLLMHMSGLSYGGDITSPVDRKYGVAKIGATDRTLEEMVQSLAGIPLKFQPGTKWHYSVSTDVCGRLVEVISGQRFDRYLESEIFGPLGMTDTGFSVPDGELGRFSACYRRKADKTLALVDDAKASPYLAPRAYLSGGGGLVSTAADYLRFCQMLLNGGTLDGHRILSRNTISLMTSNHVANGTADLRQVALGEFGETGFDGIGFGLGFAVGLGPVPQAAAGSAGEYYWGGFASTIFWNDPVEDLTAIFMTQLIPSGTFDFRGQLKALVYGAIAD